MKIKKYKDLVNNLKEIRSRVNPVNNEYLKHVSEVEDCDHMFLFISDCDIEEFNRNLISDTVEGFVHTFFSKSHGTDESELHCPIITYHTVNCTTDDEFSNIFKSPYVCESRMRSFEDILMLTLTYYPEASYLDVFEAILKMVIIRKDGGLLLPCFYACDDICKINILTNYDYSDSTPPYERDLLLRVKIQSIYEYGDNHSPDSLFTWRGLLNQYLERENVSEKWIISNMENVLVYAK